MLTAMSQASWRVLRSVTILCLCSLASVATAGGPSDQVGPREAGAQEEAISLSDHEEDGLLVRFKREIFPDVIASLHAEAGVSLVQRYTSVHNLQRLRVGRGVDLKRALAFFKRHPAVLYAEPIGRAYAFRQPNDPDFSYSWALQNTVNPSADINAPAAWDLTTGSRSVVVATIDSGLDYTHQDLGENVFRNTAEIDGNGLDDDGNGYADDYYGINTVYNNSDPMDDYDHGTHVAGIIGAVGNDGVGLVGVNWQVSILPCKFLNDTGRGSYADAIECLDHLAVMKDRGVNLVAVNASWGGPYSQALRDAIDAHRQRGVLFVAAAGNCGATPYSCLLNNDDPKAAMYPASYDLPNIIAVAATDDKDRLWAYSHYGRRTVAMGAPGVGIWSLTPDNGYQIFSGTSMAAPHVTGIAALLKAETPSLDWKAIKNLILAGGDRLSSLDNTITGRRANAFGALTCANTTVRSRLQPIGNSLMVSTDMPITLSALHINCADPAGPVTVTANPGGTLVTLQDDGGGVDQLAGDGVYSGQWTPAVGGMYTLTFPGRDSQNDVVTVQVVPSYRYATVPFRWETFSGTSLDLDDNTTTQITSPFPIRFGGQSISTWYLNANGTANPEAYLVPVSSATNEPLPATEFSSVVRRLIAPFWDDLQPVKGSSQNVFWWVTGTAPNQMLVVEWRDVRHADCPNDSAATVKFQLVFPEGKLPGGKEGFWMNFDDVIFGGACTLADRGGSATVGVQMSSSLATQLSYNAPRLANKLSLEWTWSGVLGGSTAAAQIDRRHCQVNSWAIKYLPLCRYLVRF